MASRSLLDSLLRSMVSSQTCSRQRALKHNDVCASRNARSLERSRSRTPQDDMGKPSGEILVGLRSEHPCDVVKNAFDQEAPLRTHGNLERMTSRQPCVSSARAAGGQGLLLQHLLSFTLVPSLQRQTSTWRRSIQSMCMMDSKNIGIFGDQTWRTPS